MPIETVWIGGVMVAALMTLVVALLQGEQRSNLPIPLAQPKSPENKPGRRTQRLG
jgi:hypothetical protein